MKILAFDTSSSGLSVALFSNQKLLTKNTVNESGKQSELLIPTIEKTLHQNKIWYRDLDLIVSTRGPGSFTGTRIALTTARTLKIATNLPLILLNSCEVLAHKYRNKSEKIFVLIDAKADEFFYAKFDNNLNSSEPHSEPNLAKLEDLLKIFPQEKFFLCGSGKKIAGEILKNTNSKFEMSDDEDEIEADMAGLLAYQKLQNDEFNDGFFGKSLNPIYLRSPRISERKK